MLDSVTRANREKMVKATQNITEQAGIAGGWKDRGRGVGVWLQRALLAIIRIRIHSVHGAVPHLRQVDTTE